MTPPPFDRPPAAAPDAPSLPAAGAFTIRGRIRRLWAVAGAGLLAALVLTVTFGLANHAQLRRVERGLYPMLQLDRVLLESLDDTQDALRAAVAVRDSDRVAEADSVGARFSDALQAAAGIEGLSAAARDSLDGAFARYYAAARRGTVGMLARAEGDTAYENVTRMVHEHRALRGHLAARLARDEMAVTQAFARVRRFQSAAWVSVAVVTIGCVGLLAWMAVVTTRGIVRPLEDAVGVADRLAAGDLAVTFPRAPGDEIGRLLGALRYMVERMAASIRELQASEARLAASDEWRRLLLETVPDAIATYDASGRLTLVNAAASAFVGVPREALLGQPVRLLVDPEERPAVDVQIAAVLGGASVQSETRLTGADGRQRVAAYTSTPLRDGGAAVTGALLVARDVTEERQAVEALHRSEARFRALVQQSSDVVVVFGEDGSVLYASPSIARVCGYADDEIMGRPLASLVHPDDLSQVRAALAAARGPGATASFRNRLRHANGGWRHMETVVTNLLHEPAVGGWVCNTRDVTERTMLEEQLTHQAFHDPLTGLANRALFRDRVEHALALRARGDDDPASVAVLFLDLDNFKTVNDSLGHAAGDRLLSVVSSRLLNVTRGCDTVARLGGDEFAILLQNLHADAEATIVADRVTSAMRVPVVVDGKEVFVGASVGIAFGRTEPGGEPMTAEALLRNADAAMYDAKGAGKGRHAIYNPALHAAAVDRMELETDLARAVERGEFELMFQPIVDLASGKPVAAEALIRWQHPTRGLVSPVRFIPLAEETGQIVAIGRWVLAEACRIGAEWTGGISVTVNVSGRQLEDPGLVDDVRAALDASGLDASRLTLEITESVIMRDTELTLGRLHELKALGVRLAIDDFGTGYSSLSYLRQFPIDVIKIDKSFIDGVSHGGHEAALARTIVALGEMLSLRTVAEGIEEPEQRAELRELGCVLGQGYLFARPVRASAIGALVNASLDVEPRAVA